MSMRPIIPSASCKVFFSFPFPNGKNRSTPKRNGNLNFGEEKENTDHYYILLYPYLFLFQKCFCQLPAFWLQVKVSHDSCPDKRSASSSPEFGTQIQACPLSDRLPIVRFSRSQFLLSNAPLVSILSTVPHTHKVPASWFLS